MAMSGKAPITAPASQSTGGVKEASRRRQGEVKEASKRRYCVRLSAGCRGKSEGVGYEGKGRYTWTHSGRTAHAIRSSISLISDNSTEKYLRDALTNERVHVSKPQFGSVVKYIRLSRLTSNRCDFLRLSAENRPDYLHLHMKLLQIK